jgi:hypothetical protein
MGAISMKVNPAFVSILIITSSLAIHLSTYIQSSYRFWGWAPFMALTPFLRCLRPLLWGGLILGSYHGPHTFSWGVFACCHEMVWTWTHIMVLTPSIRGVSACRHETVWTWTHIMVLTPSIRGVSTCCHTAVYTWARFMAHTPSPEVSPSVMKWSHPPSSGMSPVAPRFSTTMWTWERSLPLTT